MQTNKKGKLQIYCADCDKYFVMNDEQFNWSCPECGNILLTMRCTRCGHKWTVRNRDKLPKICANPKCHSPYWNRQRCLDRGSGKLVPADKVKKK